MELDEETKTELMKHIHEHVNYPATKEELVMACNKMDHISQEGKNWFSENLPDGTYNNADEVMKALGM